MAHSRWPGSPHAGSINHSTDWRTTLKRSLNPILALIWIGCSPHVGAQDSIIDALWGHEYLLSPYPGIAESYPWGYAPALPEASLVKGKAFAVAFRNAPHSYRFGEKTDGEITHLSLISTASGSATRTTSSRPSPS